MRERERERERALRFKKKNHVKTLTSYNKWLVLNPRCSLPHQVQKQQCMRSHIYTWGYLMFLCFLSQVSKQSILEWRFPFLETVRLFIFLLNQDINLIHVFLKLPLEAPCMFLQTPWSLTTSISLSIADSLKVISL
jgi:hypothetical protein